ncbi:hypothetical protein Bca52824_010968 [Brassica carinata]|uniref:Uncharacterized protein n=1 Tax=Brassica carinata TaxID=52824 RepID=A0A8X8BAN6_BRACI|nr:hypothetical protein Bca52824_010968 [Brassica carinata]
MEKGAVLIAQSVVKEMRLQSYVSQGAPSWLTAICFAIGRIILGETEVVKNIDFAKVWKCGRCARIYKPVGIPEGFHCSGHGCMILQLVTEPKVYFCPEETYMPSSVPWFVTPQEEPVSSVV